MSNILGGLRSFNVDVLTEHLPLLGSGECVFTLQVSDGSSERVIYWNHGRLFVLSNGERSGPGILERLVLHGKLDPAAAERILAEEARSEASLEELVLAEGAATQGEYAAESRALALDELRDLVFWDNALFLSYEAPPPADFFVAESRIVEAKLPPRELAEEVSDWIRKWSILRQFVDGDQVLLQAAEDTSDAEAGPLSGLGGALEKPRTIRELRRRLVLPLPELCERLARGIESGRVTTRPEAHETTTPKAAIEKLEAMLPHAVGKDLVRLKLASLYRKEKRIGEACAAYQHVADETASRGDWLLASDCLKSLIAIRPEDLDPLRELLKLSLDRGLERQGFAAAMQVEASLLRGRKSAELEDLAEILGAVPGAELLAEEVRTSVDLLGEEPGRAVEKLRALADRHEERGDLDRALQVLGKALEWNPEDEALKKRLVVLKQKVQHAAEPFRFPARSFRARRRAMIVAAAAIGALGLFGFVVFHPPGKAASEGSWNGPVALAESVRERETGDGPAPDGSPPSPSRAYGASDTESPDGLPAGAPSRPSPPRSGPRPSRPRASNDSQGPQSSHARGEPSAPDSGAPPASGKGRDRRGTQAASAALAHLPAVQRSVDSIPGTPRSRTVLGSPYTPEEIAERVEPLLRAATPNRPCPRHGEHSESSRRLWDDRRLRFAHGCSFRIEDPGAGDEGLYLEAEPGTRWSYDADAETIAVWAPDRPLRTFRAGQRNSETRTPWRLPTGTQALAIGERNVAVCLGETTRLLRLSDGVEVRSGPLPPWVEGFFIGNRLCLAIETEKGDSRLAEDGSAIPKGAPEAGPRSTIVVDASTLAVLLRPKDRPTDGKAASRGDGAAGTVNPGRGGRRGPSSGIGGLEN